MTLITSVDPIIFNSKRGLKQLLRSKLTKVHIFIWIKIPIVGHHLCIIGILMLYNIDQ